MPFFQNTRSSGSIMRTLISLQKFASFFATVCDSNTIEHVLNSQPKLYYSKIPLYAFSLILNRVLYINYGYGVCIFIKIRGLGKLIIIKFSPKKGFKLINGRFWILPRNVTPRLVLSWLYLSGKFYHVIYVAASLIKISKLTKFDERFRIFLKVL